MTGPAKQTPLALIYGIALIAVVIWGGSTVATKLAVNELPPLAVAVLRTVIGGLAALVVATIKMVKKR